jgi:hypothetical protein
MNSGKIFKMCFILSLFISVAVMLLSSPDQVSATNKKYNRVARLGTPKVDGDLNDPVWQKADWQEMDVYAGGAQPKNFKAKSAVLWDDNFLYTAIDVNDDTHASPKAVVVGADSIWQGDSVQHRVDLEYDSAPNSGDDIEWGYALQDGKVLTCAWSGAGNIDFDTVKIIRDDKNKKTYYEAALVLRLVKSKQTLSKYIKENKDAKIGYSDMVNANDGGARLGWLEWSSGIGAAKDANQFGTLTFDSKPMAINIAGKLVSTWGIIKNQ